MENRNVQDWNMLLKFILSQKCVIYGPQSIEITTQIYYILINIVFTNKKSKETLQSRIKHVSDGDLYNM